MIRRRVPHLKCTYVQNISGGVSSCTPGLSVLVPGSHASTMCYKSHFLGMYGNVESRASNSRELPYTQYITWSECCTYGWSTTDKTITIQMHVVNHLQTRHEWQVNLLHPSSVIFNLIMVDVHMLINVINNANNWMPRVARVANIYHWKLYHCLCDLYVLYTVWSITGTHMIINMLGGC